jgi:uncharacterized lipoprotein YddW (UPF0748 family)
MVRLMALVLACLLGASVIASGVAADTDVVVMDPPELRAVWVDAFHDGFKTREQVDRLVTWAREANLNALFVQVRRRGDAYYLKSMEPRAEDPDLAPDFDPLQYLIDRARQGPQKLQVHAWLATLPIWHKRDEMPRAPSHVINRYGLDVPLENTWLMLRDDGKAWAGDDASGTYYLDPGHPDAARHTAEVSRDLLRHYDVDGIHLDQVRYYEGDARRWGYNPTSVERFNQRNGREPLSQPSATDPAWLAWRREQVTALVRRIYLEAKAVRPNIVVSAAVVTWGIGPTEKEGWERMPAYASVFQDWRAWLREGIVDYLLPMDYYREVDPHAEWFDNWTRWQIANPGQRGVVIGVAGYLNEAGSALAQLTRARALGPLGVAVYSYAVPTRDLEHGSIEDRAAFAARLRILFPRPADAPALAWQIGMTTGSLLVEVPGRENVLVQLEGEPARRTWRTDGMGVAGGVDVPPGRYLLSVLAPEVDATPIEVRIEAGRTLTVRFGPGAPIL